jgi:hypothetical protein
VRWRDATEFTPEIRECLIATGFLRTAADDTDENELNTLDIRHGVLQRTGEVLANNLLGLTLNCAKCHDHKYEPLTQRDYYQFLALLQPAFNPDKWLQPKQRLLASIPSAEKAASEQANADIAVLTKRLEELKKVDTPPSVIEVYEKKLAEAKSKQRKWENWHVVYDSGPPSPTCILRRGDHLRPGAEVAPGFLEVLQSDSIALIPKWDAAASSGRRLALAKWLNNADTPAGALVLRVRVNRILRHLFGRGIVESVDNLGVTGAKPSHPELLDWLAAEFLRGERRLKPFLRMLMTSAAYRQLSQVVDRSPAKSSDPDNHLLWRMPLRRLESEVVRDSIIAVSGVLDSSMGGPPIPVEPKPDGSFIPKDGNNPRRSVYLLARRNYHPTLLGVFDQPVLTTNCTGRQGSAVVLQSLTMLNDRFMQEQAANVARRVKATAKPGQEIETAFRIVLGRLPKRDEHTIAAELIDKQSSRDPLAHLCHVLLNTSEFLYAP